MAGGSHPNCTRTLPSSGGMSMRQLIGSAVLVASLAGVPAAAVAQHMDAKHELGVDLGIVYNKLGSGCSVDCGSVSIGTPVDVRFGFVSSGALSFEPRFTLGYISGGGDHILTFSPDVNLLYRMGSSTARKGMYLTGGAGISLVSASIGGTSSSASQLSVNGGIGTRVPYESGAWRLEAFFRYNLENSGKGIPSSIDIGARIGISLWH